MDNIPSVKAINSEQYPTPVKRPAFSVLNTGKIEMLDISPSDWEKALEVVLPKLI